MKPTPLAERRAHLVAEAARQRLALAQAIEPWRAPLALADRGRAALDVLRRHPFWLLGAIGALSTLRHAPARRWLGRGWLAWRLLRRLP
jgi:hypothetical protein